MQRKKKMEIHQLKPKNEHGEEKMAKNNFVVEDSGKREQMETGSQRDSREGKGRFDLMSAYAIFRIARVYEEGAKKYKEHNWRKGQKLSRYLDSAKRHLNCFQAGMKREDHLAQCCWNLMAMMELQQLIKAGKMPKELDDLSDSPWLMTEEEYYNHFEETK